MIETDREKAETNSFEELGKVYNRLQDANKIIAELVDHLRILDPGKPWPNLPQFMDKSNQLVKTYGDINGY